jgi:TonB family protein
VKKALLYSLLFHVLVVGLFWWRESIRPPSAESNPATTLVAPQSIATRVLSDNELSRIVETALAEKMNSTPEDLARYRGEQTQRVKQETRAQGFGSSTGGASQSERSKSQNKRGPLDKLGALWKLPIQGEVRETAAATNPGLSKGSLDPLGPEVAIGSETLLNTDEYIYAGFFNRVKREVAPRWEPMIQRFLKTTLTLSDGSFSTRYAFFIDAEGLLKDLQLLESSGSRTLDDLAAQALREVGRFPNPPQSLRSAGGLYRVELGFMVEYSKKRFHTDYVPDPRFR